MPDKSDSPPATTPPATIGGSFRRLVGFETLVWREGCAKIRLVIRPDHLNRQGMVHGGVYATLLDVAFGHAVSWSPTPDKPRLSVTVSLTTTYLKGVDRGVLTASGQVEGIRDRMVTCTGEICNEAGLLLAVGQASFIYMP